MDDGFKGCPMDRTVRCTKPTATSTNSPKANQQPSHRENNHSETTPPKEKPTPTSNQIHKNKPTSKTTKQISIQVIEKTTTAKQPLRRKNQLLNQTTHKNRLASKLSQKPTTAKQPLRRKSQLLNQTSYRNTNEQPSHTKSLKHPS